MAVRRALRIYYYILSVARARDPLGSLTATADRTNAERQ